MERDPQLLQQFLKVLEEEFEAIRLSELKPAKTLLPILPSNHIWERPFSPVSRIVHRNPAIRNLAYQDSNIKYS